MGQRLPGNTRVFFFSLFSPGPRTHLPHTCEESRSTHHPHSGPGVCLNLKKGIIMFPFYREQSGGRERLSALPKVTQLKRARSGGILNPWGCSPMPALTPSQGCLSFCHSVSPTPPRPQPSLFPSASPPSPARLALTKVGFLHSKHISAGSVSEGHPPPSP